MTGSVTIAAALGAARASVPAGEARQLLRYVLGCSTSHLEAHREDPLPVDAGARFADFVARRAAGEPVAYLTGTREFYGRDFAVTRDVLIPRAETELLVDLAIASLRDVAAPRLIDLGTGSGCIAVTLALEIGSAQVTAVDFSAAALALARQNAERHGADIELLTSDWFASLADRRYDLIVANPPYIPETDPHLRQGDLRFEPRHALASGADGLSAIGRIVDSAAEHLLRGGRLWLEHGYDQADSVRRLLAGAGYTHIEQHRDLAGIVRVSGGRLPL